MLFSFTFPTFDVTKMFSELSLLPSVVGVGELCIIVSECKGGEYFRHLQIFCKEFSTIMSKILTRINQFAESQGLSIREIERSIGATNGVISGAIKNNREIGSDKLENFLQAFSNVSAEWLLRGIGEMLTQSEDSVMKNPTLDFVIRHMASQIDELKAQVKYLETKNDELRDERDDLVERNHELEKELARKGETASIVTGSSAADAV